MGSVGVGDGMPGQTGVRKGFPRVVLGSQLGGETEKGGQGRAQGRGGNVCSAPGTGRAAALKRCVWSLVVRSQGRAGGEKSRQRSR